MLISASVNESIPVDRLISDIGVVLERVESVVGVVMTQKDIHPLDKNVLIMIADEQLEILHAMWNQLEAKIDLNDFDTEQETDNG